MTRQAKRFTYAITAILIALLVLISLTTGGGAQIASAAASAYSDVLDDLRTDKSFNVGNYPALADDYSLQVIHIAESTDGELLIYVYQPCIQKPYKASTISIAEQMNNSDDLQPALYNLQFENSNGVFYKYKVEGYRVSKEKERFYNLIMIQRPFISGVDAEGASGNTINRKAFAVGQYWYVTTDEDGNVTYKMLNVDYVEVKNPFTSRIRKAKAATSSTATHYYQDNYFVAFETNRNITKLMSATVSYRTRDYFYKTNSVLGFGSTEFNERATFSNERFNNKEVQADEVINLQQEGFGLWFIDTNKSFSWSRIQTAEDFVRNAGASEEDNQEVMQLQWVLLFNEVSVYQWMSDGTIITAAEESGQIIDFVTVLRLEFVENGITYNLGTVSDTVSKDFDFNGKGETIKRVPWWVWLIVAAGTTVVVLLFTWLSNFAFSKSTKNTAKKKAGGKK